MIAKREKDKSRKSAMKSSEHTIARKEREPADYNCQPTLGYLTYRAFSYCHTRRQ